MPSSSSPVAPPLLAERTVARSRSRYKGPRLHKTPTDTLDSSSFGGEQLRRLVNIPLSPHQSRPQNNRDEREGIQTEPPGLEALQRLRNSADDDDAQKPALSVSQDRGYPRKADNHTHSRKELIPLTDNMQDYQQKCQLEHNAGTDLRNEAGRDSLTSQKAAASSGQCYHLPRPDLHSRQIKRAAATIGSPALLMHQVTERDTRDSNGKRPHKTPEKLKSAASTPIPIESDRDVKPAFDAPVSAVNAGERKVKVKFGQTLILLPVTPSTTTSEIIGSAINQLPNLIDPKSAVLFESFKLLGLERPLRRYEHIRDVLNSWNHDTHNTLIIKQSPTGSRDELLDFNFVSAPQPADTSVYIHYSQRPGRWDKQWVTLRSDGQMLVAKREGGETANICHMSDFDIYIPTLWQSAKRIRPPRKICFAVKSQQKSNMFLSTANFVHFFSTSDRTLATTWYAAVRDWRSWYLVNVMGEGEECSQNWKSPAKSDDQKLSKGMNCTRASTLENLHTKHLDSLNNPKLSNVVVEHSVDDTTFCNRNNLQSWQSKEFYKDDNIGTFREKSPSVMPQESEPFAATGLLGRTYTKRQTAQRERANAQNASSDQRAATRNVNQIVQFDRALSQRPKPLIDLTPHFQEPPQHARKGRGVILEQIPAGGLVEAASTPDAAIPTPPSSTWRRLTSNAGVGPSVDRSKAVGRGLSNGRPQT